MSYLSASIIADRLLNVVEIYENAKKWYNYDSVSTKIQNNGGELIYKCLFKKKKREGERKQAN